MVQKCVITVQKSVITVRKCVITMQKIAESLNHACTYTNFSIYLISMVWMCHFLSAWWVHSFLVTIVGLHLGMEVKKNTMQRWLPSSWITTDPTRLLLRYGNSHFPFTLRPGNTGNIFLQLARNIVALQVEKCCCPYYHPPQTLSRNKICCCKLKKFVEKK